ncbi:hypothetical protein GBAR_LOCUS6357, partial [Geodia barretti]
PQSERCTGDDNGGDGATAGQVSGILLGGIIAGLFTTLIIIILFFLCWKYRKQSYKSQSEFNELVNEPGRKLIMQEKVSHDDLYLQNNNYYRAS